MFTPEWQRQASPNCYKLLFVPIDVWVHRAEPGWHWQIAWGDPFNGPYFQSMEEAKADAIRELRERLNRVLSNLSSEKLQYNERSGRGE